MIYKIIPKKYIVVSEYAPECLMEVFMEQSRFNDLKEKVQFLKNTEIEDNIIKKNYGLYIEDDIDAIINFFENVEGLENPELWIVCRNLLTANTFVSTISKPPMFVGLDFSLESEPVSKTQIIYEFLKEKWKNVPVVGITNYENSNDPAHLSLKNVMRTNTDSVYLKEIIYKALPNIIRDKIAISKFQREIKEAEEKNKNLKEENIDLKNTIKLLKDFDIKVNSNSYGSLDEFIIGNSNAMNRVKFFIQKYSETDDNVLIVGETGTGKELVAEAIHKLSSRKDNPFIPINCAAIPESLIESELFGHKKGAFTDASHDKTGAFEEADNGTIFLDEIDRMSLNGQAKLLRFLEDYKVKKMGGSEKEVKIVNVRVIAAMKPIALNKIGNEFLEDLYARLYSIFPIIPPLKERKEDIPQLINHFIDLIGYKKHLKTQGLSPRSYSFPQYRNARKDNLFTLDEKGIKLLSEYKWDRNVRELKKFIENIFTIFVDNKKIRNNQTISVDDVKCAFIFHNNVKKDITPEEQKLLINKFTIKSTHEAERILDKIEGIISIYKVCDREGIANHFKTTIKGKEQEYIKPESLSAIIKKNKSDIQELFSQYPEKWVNARNSYLKKHDPPILINKKK